MVSVRTGTMAFALLAVRRSAVHGWKQPCQEVCCHPLGVPPSLFVVSEFHSVVHIGNTPGRLVWGKGEAGGPSSSQAGIPGLWP